MNKCITKEFLCSTDGKWSPEKKSDLPKAFQPYHSWGRPDSMAPSPPPAQGSGPHFRGSRVLSSHTRGPASCLPEAHPCLLPTHANTSSRVHMVIRVGPSAANTKHTTI